MSSWPDLTGETIAGKYELVRLIGRGGMGAVYEARSVATLKRCALKVLLSSELAGDAEVVKRFFREARASGLVESEHVVTAFDSGVDAGTPYYVMECLQGEDLEQAIERLGQLQPFVAAKVALQAATGLAKAHALGIVHRDIKPANLFLASVTDDEVRVKILDFGVAKVKMDIVNESAGSLTQSGSLLGTLPYMSPEQLRGAGNIDEAADLWSLGMVLFESLTGTLPWPRREGLGELVTAILSAPLPNPQDLAPWVQPGLAGIVERLLARDAGRRLRTAKELCEALREVLGADSRLYAREIVPPSEVERSSRAPRHAAADTVMLGPTPPSETPVVIESHPRSRSWLKPGLLGVAAAALGASSWLGRSQPQRPLHSSESNVSIPSSVSVPPSAPVAPPPPAPPPVRRFTLRVVPPDARVVIDGEIAKARSGEVSIEGSVDSSRMVRVTAGKRSTEVAVVLTRDGLVPDKVVLPTLRAVGSTKTTAVAAASAAPTLARPVPTSPDVTEVWE